MKKNNEKVIFYEDIQREQIDQKLPMFEKDDFVPEDKIDAMNNPFLYFGKNISFGKNIQDYNTIEEFGLKYKKRNIYVGSIIRNCKLSKRLRTKILKKYLKNQKKDFKKQINRLKENHSSTENLISLVSIKKTKFKYILLMLILIILNVLLLTLFRGKLLNIELGKIINNKWIISLSNNLVGFLKENIWIQILLFSSFTSIIIIVVYFVIYKKIVRKYTKEKKKYQNEFDIKIKQTNKCFVSEYRKIKYFYLKKIKEGKIYYEALGLSKLWDLDTSLNDFNDEKNRLENRTNKINKFLKADKVIKFLLILICLITNIFLFIIVIINGLKII